jgi:ribosomal-protein-alanine N-acetyltransferase
MNENLIFTTERLILRPFSLDDVDNMFELNSVFEVVQYTGDAPFKNKQEVFDLISTYNQYEKYGMGRLTMILKSTGEYLGWTGIKFNENIQQVDLGFRLMKKYWGKGYATEGALACLQFGFEKKKIEKIIGRALTDNKASIRVLEKVGMSFEKNIVMHNAPAAVYSISKSQWEEKRS